MQTIAALKQEVVESSASLEGLRKEKHALELMQIEDKDRYSDLFVKNSSLSEDFNKASHEVSGFSQRSDLQA